MNAISTLARALALFALLAIATMRATAQSPPCDTCYRHYAYDTVFRMGAHLINNARIARDSLHFDFGHYYGKSFTELARQVRGDAGNETDALNHAFFDSASMKGLKTIFVPGRVDQVMKSSGVVEDYIGKDCRFTNDCGPKRSGKDEPTLQVYDLYQNHTDGLEWDTLWHGKLYAVKAPADGGEQLVAGGPSNASYVMAQGSVDMYKELFGDPLDPSKDSSKFFSFTVTLKVEPESLATIGDDAVIARVVLYKRWTDNQGDNAPEPHCICRIYAPWETINITKRMYNDPSTLTLQRSRSDPEGLHPYRDIVVKIFKWEQATVPPPSWSGLPYSPWFGPPTSGAACSTYCASLSPPSGSITDDALISDIQARIYTTGLVGFNLLRTRTAQYGYEMLKGGRLDDYLKKDIDTMNAWPAMRDLISYLNIDDEPEYEQFRPGGLLADRLQRILHAAGNTSIGIWTNPIKNYDGFEILSQDIEAKGLKLFHTMAPQWYIGTGPIPIHYANPDFMDPEAFKFNGQGHVSESVWFNTLGDYETMTTSRQASLGTFRQIFSPQAVMGVSFVAYAGRGVDVGRFKYRSLGVPPISVEPVVRVHGWITAENFASRQFWASCPTPEEITAQSWLAMNCGADGILFSDFIYSGSNVGVMKSFTGEHSTEYEVLGTPKPNETLPVVWSGFRSRFGAVKRVADELRHIDDVVGWHHMIYNHEQMSLHDPGQYFKDMPLLDTVYTRAAQRWDTALGGGYLDSVDAAHPLSPFDAKEKTFMEVTHFRPKPGRADSNARYLLFTNRRTWPLDTTHYGQRARDAGAEEYGLGYIDVRRPVVKLKNDTPFPADSFLVEKVGHEEEWPARKVAVGEALELDWLNPGWGALYRLTPVKAAVATHGTAFNNGVHADNPSTDATEHDRIVVYERDSIVYMRTIDSMGVWSGEYMISDPLDAVVQEGHRVASNFVPAVATVRNGNSCLVVWEREALGKRSVEGLMLPSLPTRNGLDPYPLPFTICPPKTLDPAQSWMELNPAVVGLNGGYVVAWASPANGIELAAIRDTMLGPSDISTVVMTKMATPPASGAAARYPTLAYRPNKELMTCDGCVASQYGVAGGPGLPPVLILQVPGGPGGGSVTDSMQVVHLAYQQGVAGNDWRQAIYYNPVGVKFPSQSIPFVWVMPTELVSAGVNGCTSLHPSIAADSLRVGVAFDDINRSASTVVLRFRDPAPAPPGGVKRWSGPVYRWGGKGIPRGKSILLRATNYERPSVTQLPSLPVTTLAAAPEGGLVWQWAGAPSGHANVVRFYRYGDLAEDSVAYGRDPSMMLVPRRRSDTPFAASGIFHRGEDASHFEGSHPIVGKAWYYPAALRSAPREPLERFLADNGRHGINAGLTISKRGGMLVDDCEHADVGVNYGLILEARKLVLPDPNGWTPRLPSAFFGDPGNPDYIVDEVWKVPNVVRTSGFMTGGGPVKVRRLAIGSDELGLWLDGQPFDVANNRPADVALFMELVRQSDGAVLWRGDSMKARSIDAQVRDEEVTVPADQVTPPGTKVYLRLQAVPSAGIDYELVTDFHFVEDSSGGFIPVLPVLPRGVAGGGSEAGERTMRCAVVPNPASTSAEVRVDAAADGTLDAGIYDMMGRLVRLLPATPVHEGGEYTLTVDLSEMAAGTYTVRAAVRGYQATMKFSVVK
jgi:hypothetical protein